MIYQEILNSEEITELNKILPVVKKVHSDHHPELVKVNDLYNELKESLSAQDTAEKIKGILSELISTTSDFTVPSDACPTYKKAYCDLECLVGKIRKEEK